MNLRSFLALVFSATLLFACSESGTTSPTASDPANPNNPSAQSFEEEITFDDFNAIAGDIQAFSLQFYTDDGLPLDLQWIEDPQFVDQFLGSINLDTPPEEDVAADLKQSVYVRTFGGEEYRFYVYGVNIDEPGFVVFQDGTVGALPSMHATISSAYGLVDYDSSKEKEKETETPPRETEPWSEENLIDDSAKNGPWTDIVLVVYQDDPGKTTHKKNAERVAKANAPNSQTFGINGKNSLVNELRRLKAACKRVKKLIMFVHGSPGSFRVGPKGTPVNGPTRVGGGTNQTSAQSFGQSIKAYLAPNAEIVLGSCKTAKGQAGKNFIQALADASCAKVTASDADVMCKRNGSGSTTAGHTHTATPNSPPPADNGVPTGNYP